MNSTRVSFKAFYLEKSISGHFLLRPSIYLGRSVKKIFSLPTQRGKDLAVEITKRTFSSLLCLLIALPCALLIPVGLVVKGISWKFSTESLAEENTLLSESFAPLLEQEATAHKINASSESSLSSEEVTTSLTTKENNIKIDASASKASDISEVKEISAIVPLSYFVKKDIFRDGNCAFNCFLRGVNAELEKGREIEIVSKNVKDLRTEVSEWLSGKLEAMKEVIAFSEGSTLISPNLHNRFIELQAWLKSSVQDWLEECKRALQEELEQVQLGLASPKFGNYIHCQKRLMEIPSESKSIEEKIVLFNEAIDLIHNNTNVQEILQNYFDAMKEYDSSKKIYHASAIQLYAFSQIFSVNLKVYIPFLAGYKEFSSFSPIGTEGNPIDPQGEISFLLEDNHYDLLIKN